MWTTHSAEKFYIATQWYVINSKSREFCFFTAVTNYGYLQNSSLIKLALTTDNLDESERC